MAQDRAQSVLVGRPCYYVEDNDCDPRLWTSERYGERVVAAMADAIEAELARSPGSRVVLIGYSGGGALAMLLAPRLREVERVVTIAGNLDVGAWARHHGYAPLEGSLDPASQPLLPPRIAQAHLFGADDDNVPAALMRHVAERQAAASIRVMPDFDHACCWARDWPALVSWALAAGTGPATAP